MRRVDLDGYAKNAARQEGQVAAKARKSRDEPKRGKIECSRHSGRSSQPWKHPDTVGGAETKSLMCPCMMENTPQNIINSRQTYQKNVSLKKFGEKGEIACYNHV